MRLQPLVLSIVTLILLVPFGILAQPAPGKFNFSHKKHVQEAGIECLSCHTNAPENAGGGATNHPKMENCKQCHEEPMAENNCAFCHVDSTTKKPFKVELHHKNFSHKAHLNREVQCAVCHLNIEQVDWATAKNLPGMDVCLSCHDNKKAPRNCNLCHDDPEKKRPASHSLPSFTGRGHGRDARFARLKCETCHDESFCDRCHRGLDKRKIHSVDFQITHGREARKADKNCAVCHESERFCAACHQGRK